MAGRPKQLKYLTLNDNCQSNVHELSSDRSFTPMASLNKNNLDFISLDVFKQWYESLFPYE